MSNTSESHPKIRPLCEVDWEMLRTLRLRALQSEPGMFSSSYEDERNHQESHWRRLASNENDGQRIFGLFAGDVLIGITAAFTYRGDPTGRTAILAMSYILPEYRGRRLSRLYYEARLAWIRSASAFEVVRVSHRRSNERSRRANQRHAFVETCANPVVWLDGITEDEVVYELPI
jgi:GNAT superfamily N-acetyltransferase